MRRSLVAAAFLLCSVPATGAVNFTCTGTVNYLGVSNVGDVFIDNGNGTWEICNLSGPYGSTSKEACAAWYSGLLTARAREKTITLYFNPDDNSGISSCAALGTWISRTPYFVQLD